MAKVLPLAGRTVKKANNAILEKSATLAGDNPDFSITEFYYHAPTRRNLTPAFVANNDCWPAMVPVRVGDQRDGIANGTKPRGFWRVF